MQKKQRVVEGTAAASTDRQVSQITACRVLIQQTPSTQLKPPEAAS